MQNTKKYLGARIQEIRKLHGLKQNELAELVDIDSKHMSKIECGRCYPSFELLDKIAQSLNTPVASFLESDHLEDREVLTKKIICDLQKMSDDKFRQIYKIVQTFI